MLRSGAGDPLAKSGRRYFGRARHLNEGAQADHGVPEAMTAYGGLGVLR